MAGVRVAESWFGSCIAGEELMDKIKFDLQEKYKDVGLKTGKNFCLYGIEIRDPNDGQYQIGRSIFEVKDGILSMILGRYGEGFLVSSIIPQQNGNISIYYFR